MHPEGNFRRVQKETQIRRFEQTAYLEDVAINAFDVANEVFEETFASIGLRYVSPKLRLIQNASLHDQSLYYKPQPGGQGVVYMNPSSFLIKSAFDLESVMFHEMAHHAQNQLGLLDHDNPATWEENQADFLSGALFSLKRRGIIKTEEIREAAHRRYMREELSGHVQGNERHHTHGTPAMRASLFIEGATTGSIGDGLARFVPAWVPSRLRESLRKMKHPHLHSSRH